LSEQQNKRKFEVGLKVSAMMRSLHLCGMDDFVATPRGVNKRRKVGACGEH